ncbi:MAG TPA: thiamine pyrophosphate-binding protein, partial [Pseudomonadales bacterium]|nr:thiamine pyrophosphate-binding protein [Pseudomonadales bacterium]
MNFFPKLLEILNAHGVQRIFGVPGDAINPLLEALRTQDAIDYIHVAHEESGALAASAAGKLSGKLQVCAGTVGPGAVHLLNGLYDAKKDRVPVLAIVGQVPSEYLGTDYHQEVNLSAVFHDVATFIADVQHPGQMPWVAIEACNRAVAEKGVAVLVVPHDVGKQGVDDLPVTALREGDLGHAEAPAAALRDAAGRIDKAKKITLFVGEGARAAKGAVLQFAEHLKAPIVFSLKAKDMVPYDHEFTAGGIGLLGSRAGVDAMSGCDLLVVAGTDFPYREWFNHECEVIQIDSRAGVIGRRRPGAMGLNSEVGAACAWLMSNTSAKQDESHVEHIRWIKKEWDAYLHHLEKIDRDDIVHPQAVARTLGELARPGAIFTCDTGEVTVWGARHLILQPDQRFV